MSRRIFHHAFLMSLALIWLAGCGQKPSSGLPPPTAQSALNRIQLRIDTATVSLEVADDDLERQNGLMFRESLREDEGMIFIFPDSERRSFYMRNTFMPLDIAYIDSSGRITDILQMAPRQEEPTYDSSVPVPFAIELNVGWFERHRIGIGAKISPVPQRSSQ
ncbi:MAG: DUF192 domain-containing protein [Rhizobacter sp.]|nr:DUF192 domain-containing protein [Chlorobiales bacterium]